MRFGLLLCAVSTWASACQAVEGDSIRAGDVARVAPAFAAVDSSFELAKAPIVGVQRIVNAQEMAAWGRRVGVEARLKACFEQATLPLTREELLPTLKAVFPKAQVEIVELVDMRVPKGKLEFARGGLEPGGVWRGRVAYGAARSMPVSVRVRVTEERIWVEAREVLPVGRPITEDQVTVVTGGRSVLEPMPVGSLEDVVGKKPTRVLAPGAPVFASMLVTAPQVARGDRVRVEVSEGGAVVKFEAEAENPGRPGDTVFLRNPESGRRFQAKVEGKGKVAIRK